MKNTNSFFLNGMPLVILLILNAIFSIIAQDVTTNDQITIEKNFPGGNIVVDSIPGNDVYIHQDLFDTEGNWFYWYFSVKGAAGREITFHFTHPWTELSHLNVIGVRGPGVSYDKGVTWCWMGMEEVKGESFTYNFSADMEEVRFSMGMPYTEENLNLFLRDFEQNPNLEIATLGITRKSRRIERIHLGNIHGKPKYRILITARHHACEMMTNYLLEGVIQSVLGTDDHSVWFRDNVEILIIPFVDKDGVEDGDQGKNRRGRDHNRDYEGKSIYSSTRTIRSYVPAWSDGKMAVAIDLHCPFIRKEGDERIHLVGSANESIATEQDIFSDILQETSVSDGGLPYKASNNIPFGKSWNNKANYTKGKTIEMWTSEQKEVRLAGIIEFPYANVSGEVVTQTNAREYGHTLARSLYKYLLLLSKE